MTSTHTGAFAAHRSTVRRRTATGEMLAALSGAMRRAARSYTAWRATRRAIRQLQQLDERTLRDIGLTVNDVDPAHVHHTLNRHRGF